MYFYFNFLDQMIGLFHTYTSSIKFGHTCIIVSMFHNVSHQYMLVMVIIIVRMSLCIHVVISVVYSNLKVDMVSCKSC